VLCYINLVNLLGEDQPCYGFQSHGHRSLAQAHRSIEEMAAHYVALLREFQPEGPYYLGGWCFGGIVAMEMATQLTAQGQKVGMLALFETAAHKPLRGRLGFYARRVRAFLRMGFLRKLRYLKEKLLSGYTRFFHKATYRKIIEERFGFSMAHGALANREEVYRINLRASHVYPSRPYPGRIWLFNANSVGPERIPDPTGAFETLVDSSTALKFIRCRASICPFSRSRMSVSSRKN
jgi:pimeloyl-ACP methyl ester carboxylesterase